MSHGEHIINPLRWACVRRGIAKHAKHKSGSLLLTRFDMKPRLVLTIENKFSSK